VLHERGVCDVRRRRVPPPPRVASLCVAAEAPVERIAGSFTDVAGAFTDPRVGAAGPRLVNPDGRLQPSCIRPPRPFDLIAEDVALAPVDVATGACLFLRRSAPADVGPFDERSRARHAAAGGTQRRAQALDRLRVHLTVRAPRPS
jgi:hypothetical protein